LDQLFGWFATDISSATNIECRGNVITINFLAAFTDDYPMPPGTLGGSSIPIVLLQSCLWENGSYPNPKTFENYVMLFECNVSSHLVLS